MAPKLLVLALGTTGGEVGLAFKQQMTQRPIGNFYYKILYLDTSDSLKRNAKVAGSEFIHLNTNVQFWENAIRDVKNSADKNPLLHDMLYPDMLPPPPSANGAGNIRYSAAAALAMPAIRKAIRDKIATFIDQLTVVGDKRRDIAFAIVVSAVGATGSGAAELLLPLVLEAADNAGILNPNIDIIVLHPMTNEQRPLLLANTEALYAEMATTHTAAIHNRYTGRRLILGNGGQAYTMPVLADLEKTAATLLRLTMDPLYGITQEYWDSLPNRHVLRDLEPETLLPTHLSSATPITIGLANLGQQVIQIDTARLVSRLVLGPVNPPAAQSHVNTLLGLLNFLQGSDNAASYTLLLERLTAGMRKGLESSLLTETGLKRLTPLQQADTLRRSYRSDQDRIQQEESRQQIQQQARTLFKRLVTSLRAERAKYVTTDCSLTQLVNDYRDVIRRIENLQAAAGTVKVSPPWSEERLNSALDELGRGKKQLLGNLIAAAQQNLESRCEGEAVQIATEFLNALGNECAETLTRLQAFIHEARERYEHERGWQTDNPRLEAQSDYPLYIPALSTEQDMMHYYDRVSIFTRGRAQQRFLDDDSQTLDPLAIFRHELEQGMIEHFFDGHYDLIFDMMQQHVKERVQKKLERHTLLDVFESAGPSVLRDSVRQALERAQALITLNTDYATQCVEECYVAASWSTEAQRAMLEHAMKQVSETAKLLPSGDPTAIMVLYLVDGLAMPAINDLSSRCLKALLERRTMWTSHHGSSDKRRSSTNYHSNVRIGIPIYSGYGSEQRVSHQGVIHKLYSARAQSVGDYTPTQVPELADLELELVELEQEQIEVQNKQNNHSRQSHSDADDEKVNTA